MSIGVTTIEEDAMSGKANQPPPGQSEISTGSTAVAPASAGGVAAGGSTRLFAVVNADDALARGKGP